MKILFYLAVVFSFFSCKENSNSGRRSTSEVDSTAAVKSPENALEPLEDLKSVDDIKREHTYITSKIESGSMDSTSFDYNCHDEKKGKVVYFSDKGQLRLIQHTYNEYSHFSATDEYFLKDGAPFFVFYDHLGWSFIDENQTKDDITENRYYIIDNQPVKCLQKKFSKLSNNEDSLKSKMVANKEVKCASLDPLVEDFELLLKFKHQRENLICLED